MGRTSRGIDLRSEPVQRLCDETTLVRVESVSKVQDGDLAPILALFVLKGSHEELHPATREGSLCVCIAFRVGFLSPVRGRRNGVVDAMRECRVNLMAGYGFDS